MESEGAGRIPKFSASRGAALAALLLLARPALAGASVTPDSLLRSAESRIAGGTIDDRRRALEDLEECTLLAPHRPECWVALGRLRMAIEERGEARRDFAHAAAAAPDDPAPLLELAAADRWDWLENFRDDSFHDAEEPLRNAARVAQDRAEAWIQMTALALVRGDAPVAAGAAMRAQNAEPRRVAGR